MDVILDLTGHGCPLSREELTVYYNEGLTFSLGERELQGLSLFYRKLADARMIPGVPPLRFPQAPILLPTRFIQRAVKPLPSGGGYKAHLN